MAIHARKYDPPKNKIKSGEYSVNALITPTGKYICIESTTISEEGVKTYQCIQVPINVIEREITKF